MEIWEKPKSMLSYSYIFFSEPTNREMDKAALNLADPEGTGQSIEHNVNYKFLNKSPLSKSFWQG